MFKFIIIIFLSAILNANLSFGDDELYKERLAEAKSTIQEIENNSKSCKNSNYKKWNNCFAEYSFPRGTYRGQWRNGMLHGIGMYTEVWGAGI